MKLNYIKLFAIGAFALPIAGFAGFGPPAGTAAAAADDDVAAMFKTKCAVCHSPKAEKFYDPAKSTEDEQVQAVLKGKKGEKPPFMPGFEAKGMTADQAKALVVYMKSLRETPK